MIILNKHLNLYLPLQALFLTRNSSLMASRMVSARFSNVFVSKDISSLSVNRFQRHSSTSSKEGIEDIPTLASVKVMFLIDSF